MSAESPGSARHPPAWLACCLAGALVAAVTLLLWQRFNVAPGRTGQHFPMDFLYAYLPLTELAAQRLRAGELPLWNPYSCSGIPLFATLHIGILHPTTWLALLLPTAIALPLGMLLETMLAGLLATLLFLARGAGHTAAALGGILYVFACVLGQVFWPPSLAALVWLPALLLCVEKLMGEWRWRWSVALAVCTAQLVFAGYPQYLAYVFYLLVPYAAAGLAAELVSRSLTSREAMVHAAGLCVAVALGVGLAGVQLLPTLELLGETGRGAPLSDADVHYQFVARPLGLAGVLRNAIDPAPKMISSGYGFGAGYLGISTLLLLATGIIVAARKPTTWVLTAVAVVSFLLSGGYLEWSAPLYELYAALPSGSMFRDPQRLRVLTFFSVILLAVGGFDQLTRGFAELRQRPLALYAAIGCALAVAATIVLLGSGAAAARALATLVIGAGMLRWAKRPGARRIGSVLLVLLVVADLHHATGEGRGSFRKVPVDFVKSFHADGYTLLDGDEVAEIRSQLGYERLAHPALEPPLGIGPLRGVYGVSCYEPLVPRQWTELHQIVAGRPAFLQTLQHVAPAAMASFYDVASVGMVADVERRPRGPFPRVGSSEAGVRPEPPPRPSPSRPAWLRPRLLQNDDALPRAYVVERQDVQTPEAALRHVVRGDFDFHRAVILDRPAPLAPPAGEPPPLRPASIVSYAPERVVVEVDAPREALLVLTDTFFPGWKARVDGKAAEVFRANGLYRAVRVPAGGRRVEFRYEPASLRRGAWLSVASAALLTLAVVLGLGLQRGWPRGVAPGKPRARDDAG